MRDDFIRHNSIAFYLNGDKNIRFVRDDLIRHNRDIRDISSPYSRPKLIYEFLAQIDFFSFASGMVLYEEEIKVCKAIKQQIINEGNQAHYMTERYSQFF